MLVATSKMAALPEMRWSLDPRKGGDYFELGGQHHLGDLHLPSELGNARNERRDCRRWRGNRNVRGGRNIMLGLKV